MPHSLPTLRSSYLALQRDMGVDHHRTAIVEINLERVVARIFARVGIVAVDLELLYAGRVSGRLVLRAFALDLAVLRQCEFGHRFVTSRTLTKRGNPQLRRAWPRMGKGQAPTGRSGEGRSGKE